MSEEFRSVLVRTIRAAGGDRAQLRAMVYRLARFELQRQLLQSYGQVDWSVTEGQMRGLEKAIQDIEADASRETKLLAHSSANRATSNSPPSLGSADSPLSVESDAPPLGVETDDSPVSLDTADLVQMTDRLARHGASRWAALATIPEAELLPPFLDVRHRTTIRAEILPPLFETNPGRVVASGGDGSNAMRLPLPARTLFWSSFQLVLAALLSVGLYAAVMWHRHSDATTVSTEQRLQEELATLAAANRASAQADQALRAQLGGAPLPRAYGVYVVNAGKLTDLQALPIRVPDPRVGISALISTPSQSTVADGHVQFVAFRRDLVDHAPDRAMVRVVAQVSRALTFDATGHPKIADVDGAWAVRSNAYQMKVLPVADNPAMILIQPSDSNFMFSPGRYVLVLNNVGYDFSVAGKITDPAQCLERADTISLPVYSQCAAVP